MKRKIYFTVLFIFNCLLMGFTWFTGERDITGLIMLENPIALGCLCLIVLGIWLKEDYDYTVVSIGYLGYISMLIYEFLTWHIKMYGGSFDIQYSFDNTYLAFYFALFMSSATYILYKISYERKQSRYDYMYKATL